MPVTDPLKDLLDWASAEALKADNASHDMIDGSTPAADTRREKDWARAKAFYEMKARIEAFR